MKKKKSNVVWIIVLLLTLIIFYTCHYFNINFGGVYFEQLLYNVVNSEGTSINALIDGIKYVSIYSLISFIILLVIIFLDRKYLVNKYILTVKYKDKEHSYDGLYLSNKLIIWSSLFVIVISIFNCLKTLGVKEYLVMQNTKSTFIEDNYVDGSNVSLTFPKNKRNLIYIYVESLENSAMSKKNNGMEDESYIPNLEKLAINNLNFSNNNRVGGSIQVSNTSWTIAAMVAQTSGVPLKVISFNAYHDYGDSLPGVYALGDVLKDNGYKNYLMLGSDASFGGRRDYFTTHGNYEIYDYLYALDNNWIDSDYYVWWGYEDKKLFEFAKKELTKISKQDEPFNFTLLTADTHFTDGYVDEDCEKNFDTKYPNAYHCSDYMINEFIKWIKKQSFYKDTTIVIVGDHLTMQENVFDLDNYNRTIYNTFINSKVKTKNNKNRLFSSFDMYPTTLASLGVKIDGDKLGLGVNLFSDQKTILEEYGLTYVNNEIKKKSFFYDNVLLGDSYYLMYSANNN